MRAIVLIALIAAGCGDDTTVMVPGYACERVGKCCCSSTYPAPCIAATPGASCDPGQACDLPDEAGGTCSCNSGVWSCNYPYRDLSVPDLSVSDLSVAVRSD